MNCRRVESLLSNHLEGRLGREQASVVARHLAGCRSCRRWREEIAAAENELRDRPDPTPPPDLERRAVQLWLTGGGRQRGLPGRGLFPPSAPAAVAAAVATRRSLLHVAVLAAALLLAILVLELPAAGERGPGLSPSRSAAALL
jgi:predicted anti-sigma-YlaC factor YlaD